MTSLTCSSRDWSITYDSDDQIESASDSVSGENVAYAYDGLARRVSASDSAGSRRYLVAPNFGSELESPQAVVDAATGDLTSTFVYAGEHAVMRIDAAGNPVYYLRDTMGSVLSLTDVAGTEVGEFEYDAFGNERSATGSQASLPGNLGGDFRYHGQWQERATGLYYVRARTYDPESGRFLSQDPIEGAELAPETFHPYSWNANNPWVYRDPTGLFSLVSISVGQGIQQNLRNVGRQAILGFFRNELRDRVTGVAGDVALSFLKTVLPANVGALNTIVGAASNEGGAFENFVLGEVCKYVPSTLRESVRAFPQLSRNGKPASGGISCRGLESGFGEGFTARNSIDIVLSPIDLVGKSSVASGQAKAYLGIEVKLNSRAFLKKTAQLNAQIGFARRFVGARSLLLVVLRADPGQARLERKLASKMVGEGVVVFVLSLVD